MRTYTHYAELVNRAMTCGALRAARASPGSLARRRLSGSRALGAYSLPRRRGSLRCRARTRGGM